LSPRSRGFSSWKPNEQEKEKRDARQNENHFGVGETLSRDERVGATHRQLHPGRSLLHVGAYVCHVCMGKSSQGRKKRKCSWASKTQCGVITNNRKTEFAHLDVVIHLGEELLVLFELVVNVETDRLQSVDDLSSETGTSCMNWRTTNNANNIVTW
jgi:hypothetical protein